MSLVIELTLRAPVRATIDVTGLTPDRLATLSEREIAELPAFEGRSRARVGDFFAVRGGNAAAVRIVGDLSKIDGLAEAMAGGELIIVGDAGRRVAARMSAGMVKVVGSVGDAAGASMSGGTLRVAGHAGDRVGAAAAGASKGMSGGEIVVEGSVGSDAAARARRGLVVIGGDAGGHAGRAMIAGTVIVFGRTGDHAGSGNKRGSIVSIGGIRLPATYRYACTYRPPHLQLTMTYLRRRHGLQIPEAVVAGLYRRYCGDAGDPGRGEILEWLAG
jgi:formylmethanofuran dehydrogenase subunit C